MKEKMVRVSLRLPVSLVKKIDKLAKKCGMSRSAFIREAIVRYMDAIDHGKSMRYSELP